MDKIRRFEEDDDSRTAFSAEVMNEIIDKLNALILMRGAGGVKIYKADSGFVIFASGSMNVSSGSSTPSSGSISYLGSGDVWL